MGLEELLLLLVVAGICGSLAETLVGYSAGGCLASVVLGFIGALLGIWLSRELGLPDFFSIRFGSTNFPLIWSVIGSALFVAVLKIVDSRDDDRE